MDLLLRSEKGSPLTYDEVDANWTAVQSAINAGAASSWPICNVMDYGATPYTSGDLESLIDNTAAFQAAFSAVSDYPLSAGAIVFVPRGKYWFTSTLEIESKIILAGEGGFDSAATLLTFAPDITGLRLYYADGPHLNGAGASYCIIQNLHIEGSVGTNPDAHGVDATCAGFRLMNVSIFGFPGNGVYIHGSADGFPNNADVWYLDNVRSDSNGRNGFEVWGGASNAGTGMHLTATGNGLGAGDATTGWGIYDHSFLGNTYIGCHVAQNGSLGVPGAGGSYKCVGENGPSLLVGCYSESDQQPGELGPFSCSIGGLHGAGLTGGTIRGGGTGVAVTNGLQVLIGDGAGTGGNLKLGGVLGDILYADKPDWGQVALRFFGQDLSFDAFYTNGCFFITGPVTTYQFGRDAIQPMSFATDKLFLGVPGETMRWLSMRDTFTTPITGYHAMGELVLNVNAYEGAAVGLVCTVAGNPGTWVSIGNLPGTAPPIYGDHLQGERVTNSAAAVGSPKGWICTVSGNPGTWVSEGNL